MFRRIIHCYPFFNYRIIFCNITSLRQEEYLMESARASVGVDRRSIADFFEIRSSKAFFLRLNLSRFYKISRF